MEYKVGDRVGVRTDRNIRNTNIPCGYIVGLDESRIQEPGRMQLVYVQFDNSPRLTGPFYDGDIIPCSVNQTYEEVE